MPAIPITTAIGYVAAAYVVFLALVLLYVAILGRKIGRLEREIVELDQLSGDREP